MYGWKKYKDYEKCIGTKDGTHKIGRVNTAAVEMTYLNWNEFEIIPIFMEHTYDKVYFPQMLVVEFYWGRVKVELKTLSGIEEKCIITLRESGVVNKRNVCCKWLYNGSHNNKHIFKTVKTYFRLKRNKGF